MLEQIPARTSGPVERVAHAGADLLAGGATMWGTLAGAVCVSLVGTLWLAKVKPLHHVIQRWKNKLDKLMEEKDSTTKKMLV